MWIEFDDEDFFLPRSMLVALRFDTEEEFLRCEQLIWEHHCYYEANRESFILTVRKTDLHIFEESKLNYQKFELYDPPELPPEEARQREEAAVQAAMAWFLERLRREQ
jgi:hypothetical protein